eukprot:1395425-Amorphochlora_amoeboformis.AAC.1
MPACGRQKQQAHQIVQWRGHAKERGRRTRQARQIVQGQGRAKECARDKADWSEEKDCSEEDTESTCKEGEAGGGEKEEGGIEDEYTKKGGL